MQMTTDNNEDGRSGAAKKNALTVACGVHAETGLMVTIFRRKARYGSGQYAAARVEADGRLARASLLRIVAGMEERLAGRSLAPVYVETDGYGLPFLWVESDGGAEETDKMLALLRTAARAEGFRV